MRTRKFIVVLVAVLMVGALLPAGAFAAFYNSQGTSADAWWSSWDWNNGEPGPSDAVIDWSVSGWTGGGIFKDAGMPMDRTKSTMAMASMSSYTPAVGDEPQAWAEFFCFAEPPDVLTFGRNLATAKLDFLAEGTLNIWRGTEPWIQTGPDEWTMRDPDETSTEMVSVVASWKATGPLTRSAYFSKERSAESWYMDRSQQTYRRASADASVVGASGTVYFDQSMFSVMDAQISSSKGHGRFSGVMY